MPDSTPQQRSSIAKRIGAWVQIVFVIALFLLWRIFQKPFWDSAEWCTAGGVLVYSVLNLYAAIVCAWAGQGNVIAARMSRLVGVVMFIVMRYILHDGFWRAASVWAGLWIVAAFLNWRARRRAMVGAPIRLAPARADR